jgi:hypothetical protein
MTGVPPSRHEAQPYPAAVPGATASPGPVSIVPIGTVIHR